MYILQIFNGKKAKVVINYIISRNFSHYIVDQISWTVFLALFAYFQNNEQTKDIIGKIDGLEDVVTQYLGGNAKGNSLLGKLADVVILMRSISFRYSE